MLASTEFTLILSMRLNTTKGKRLEGGKAERRDEDQSSGRPVGLSERLQDCKPVRLLVPLHLHHPQRVVASLLLESLKFGASIGSSSKALYADLVQPLVQWQYLWRKTS